MTQEAQQVVTPLAALKLALEALEKNTKHLPVHFDNHFEAITAIKEALAHPEQLREENERLHVENRRLIDRIETIGVPVGVNGWMTTTSTQPEQEPVGALTLGGIIDTSDGPEYEEWDIEWNSRAIEALQERLVTGDPVTLEIYTSTQPAQQEPVAWMYPDALCDRACLYLCTKGFTQFPECATTPPQRTWVGLTDDEVIAASASATYMDDLDAWTFARDIEAKLKQKNGYAEEKNK